VPVPYADLHNPQTLNLYDYVGSDPTNHADADGHRDYAQSNSTPCSNVASEECKKAKASEKKRKNGASLKGKALKIVADHPKTVKTVFITLQVVTALSGILDDGASELALPEEAAAEESLEAAAEEAAGGDVEEAAETGAGETAGKGVKDGPKDRSQQGVDDQLDSATKNQVKARKLKQGNSMDSTKKTEQNADYKNSRITSIEDVEQ
jgi:hypothetical protein